MTEDREAPDATARSDDRPYLTRSQVASLFGVSVSSVTRWARTGLIKAVRTPGGHYRFPSDETRRAAARFAAGDLTRLD